MFLNKIFTPLFKSSFTKSLNSILISLKRFPLRSNSFDRSSNHSLKFSPFYRSFCKIENTGPVKLAFNQNFKSNADYNAPPLLINHAIFGCKNSWKSISEILKSKVKPERKIVTIDTRNHGESPHTPEHCFETMAKDLKYLIDTEKFGNKVALMGHNMGGLTVTLFSLKWPENVDKLIVIDSSPFSLSSNTLFDEEILNFMYHIKLDQNRRFEEVRAQTDSLLSKLVADKKKRDYILSNLIQTESGKFKWRLNVEALLKNFDNITSIPNFEPNKKFLGPTLFIFDEASDNLPKIDFSQIRVLFPKAIFKSVKNSANLLYTENTTPFLEVVLEFLNQNNY